MKYVYIKNMLPLQILLKLFLIWKVKSILTQQLSANLVTKVKKREQESSVKSFPIAQGILHLQSLNTAMKPLYLSC